MKHDIIITHCPVEEGYEYPLFDPGNVFSLSNFAVSMWDSVWPPGTRVWYLDTEWVIQPHVSYRKDGRVFHYQILQELGGNRKRKPTNGPRQNGEPAPHTRLKQM